MYQWLVIYPKGEFIVVAPDIHAAIIMAKDEAKARGFRKIRTFEIYRLGVMDNGAIYSEGV